MTAVTLPNGVHVVNVTPHLLTFWQEGWEEPCGAGTGARL